jgi:hypothetical protein
MLPPNTTRPAAALAASEPRKTDRLAGAISPNNRPEARQDQYRDKYGHLLSASIFKNWSLAAIKALRIHRVGDEPKGGVK